MMRRLLLVAAAVALAFIPAQVGSAAKPKTKKVAVADDFYGPTKLTVPAGTTVDWVWSDTNVNSHDVKLAKAPKGAKKFHSPSAASQFDYAKKLTVPGTYQLVCTLHKTMTMTITVSKPKKK